MFDTVLVFGVASLLIGLQIMSLNWLWDLRDGDARDTAARENAEEAHDRIDQHHGVERHVPDGGRVDE